MTAAIVLVAAAAALAVSPRANAAGALVSDEFSRTVASGFGVADVGGAWSVSSSSQTKVANDEGVIYGFTGGGQDVRAWNPTVVADADILAKIRLNSSNPVGASYRVRVVVRGQSDPRNGYTATIKHNPDGSGSWALTRVVNRGGSGTLVLASGTLATGNLNSTRWWVRLDAQGSQLSVRFWRDGASEPSTWQAQVSDSYWTSGTVGLGVDTSTGIAAPYPTVGFGSFDASSPQAHGPATPSLYWGAYVKGTQYGFSGDPPWDMRGQTTFESHAGKKASLMALSVSWGGKAPNFDSSAMTAIRNHGSIPVVTWGPYDPTNGVDQPAYQLPDITNGNYDTYVRTFAQDAKAWGHPFFLRFAAEMNGNWLPWSEVENGNHPGDYVKAWRHVHDIFTSVGASNVTWLWTPSRESDVTIKPLSSLYPGDGYVDWIGIDGYNKGTYPNIGWGWQTFSQTIGSTYNNIVSFASSKPLMIAETACSEYGGSKAAWITDMLSTQIPLNYPKIKAFMWFNSNQDFDEAIETSASAQSAFATGISSLLYAANNFANLGGTTIQPLS